MSKNRCGATTFHNTFFLHGGCIRTQILTKIRDGVSLDLHGCGSVRETGGGGGVDTCGVVDEVGGESGILDLAVA